MEAGGDTHRVLIPIKTPIHKDYIVTSQSLGVGVNGKVLLCIHKNSKQKFALKILKDTPRSRREIDLHFRCSGHPNVVKIVDVYENLDLNGNLRLMMVLELMQGGELLDVIQEKSYFVESEACDIFRTLVSIVGHLHSMDIAHRDLKPENLLLTSKDKDGELKLTDFGFAKVCEMPLMTPCYTPYYVAPEVLNAEAHKNSEIRATYDKACDVWSLGVILYILLAGYPPFYSEGGGHISPGMKKRIRSGDFDFPKEEWDEVSTSVKELIRGMLHVDPTKRLTIEQVARHQWVNGSLKVMKTPALHLTVICVCIHIYVRVYGLAEEVLQLHARVYGLAVEVLQLYVPDTPLASAKNMQMDKITMAMAKDDITSALASMRVDSKMTLQSLDTAASSLLSKRNAKKAQK
eukprot:Colp12_sorted_trinity150504_noHs@17126